MERSAEVPRSPEKPVKQQLSYVGCRSGGGQRSLPPAISAVAALLFQRPGHACVRRLAASPSAEERGRLVELFFECLHVAGVLGSRQFGFVALSFSAGERDFVRFKSG